MASRRSSNPLSGWQGHNSSGDVEKPKPYTYAPEERPPFDYNPANLDNRLAKAAQSEIKRRYGIRTWDPRFDRYAINLMNRWVEELREQGRYDG